MKEGVVETDCARSQQHMVLHEIQDLEEVKGRFFGVGDEARGNTGRSIASKLSLYLHQPALSGRGRV